MLIQTTSLVAPVSGQAPDIASLKNVRQLIAFIGRQTHPRLSRHIHPHDHATSRLSRSFAEYFIELDRANSSLADEIEVAALYHDIGKYGVSETIVLKPGRLTQVEREDIEHHSVIGNRILSSIGIPVSANILEGVLHHHEHWDGTGYPDGMRGTRIPFIARMLAVCDTFISLREEREYKESWTVERAFNEMDNRMSGKVLDPYLLADFHDFYSTYKPRHRFQQHRPQSAYII